MAFDAFLKIDGIPGESTDAKHKEWIEILSFSQGVTQSASATKSSAGGASSGRSDFSDFSTVKNTDKATPLILAACATGKHIKEVIIECCRAGGDKVKFLEIKMEEVMISSAQMGGSSGGEIPTDSLSFNFGKIKWTYTAQKRADGSGGGNTTGGWDLTQNKAS